MMYSSLCMIHKMLPYKQRNKASVNIGKLRIQGGLDLLRHYAFPEIMYWYLIKEECSAPRISSL